MINWIESLIDKLTGMKRLGYRRTVSTYRRAIREMDNCDQILHHAAETLYQQLKADQVLIWLYQPQMGYLSLSHAIGQVSDHRLAELFPLDIRAETLTEMQYVANLPEGTSRQGLALLGLQVIIPISLRGSLISLGGVGYRSYRGPYSQETVYWLNLLASESALSLRNANLEEEINQLHPVYKSTIDARDDERRRLASELHDDVMAQLTTLTMTINMARSQLNRLNGSIDPKVISWLEMVEQGMPQVNQRLREIMNGLYPSVLTNLGLIAALRTHMDGLSRQPLPSNGPASTTITLTSEGFTNRIDNPDLERDLYYVARQAIDNAVNHAEADQILVHLRWGKLQTNNSISLTVRDTGRGMKDDPAALAGRNGRLGLISMRERITAWGGQLIMESELGKGTTILARIPVEQEADNTNGLQQAIRKLMQAN